MNYPHTAIIRSQLKFSCLIFRAKLLVPIIVRIFFMSGYVY